MAKSFDAQVTSWARKSEARMLAVVRTATQDMIKDAQLPRARGGRMPVDTGFLRNSMLGDVNRIPSGESSPTNTMTVSLVINRVQVGDVLYIGWVANYAKYMEAKYAFMRGASQNWDKFVQAAAKRLENSGSSFNAD